MRCTLKRPSTTVSKSECECVRVDFVERGCGMRWRRIRNGVIWPSGLAGLGRQMRQSCAALLSVIHTTRMVHIHCRKCFDCEVRECRGSSSSLKTQDLLSEVAHLHRMSSAQPTTRLQSHARMRHHRTLQEGTRSESLLFELDLSAGHMTAVHERLVLQ